MAFAYDRSGTATAAPVESRRAILGRLLAASAGGDALWLEVAAIAREQLNASASDVFCYDHQSGELRSVRTRTFRRGSRRMLRETIEGASFFAGAPRAASTAANEAIAIPIPSPAGPTAPPLAVLRVDVPIAAAQDPAMDEVERAAARKAARELIDELTPILIYSAIHRPFPLPVLTRPAQHHLDTVLALALETVCDRLGFSFAAIWLDDENGETTRLVAGRGLPPARAPEQDRPYDRRCALPQVRDLRTPQVARDWQPSFADYLGPEPCPEDWVEVRKELRWRWLSYKYERSTHVFIRLGTIGCLEAGLDRAIVGRDPVPAALLDALAAYAQHVANAVSHALQYRSVQRGEERGQKLLQLRNRLLATTRRQGGDDETYLVRLGLVARAAIDILGADIVAFHIADPRAAPSQQLAFHRVIMEGKIIGRQPGLVETDRAHPIVSVVAGRTEPLYLPDAQQHPLLRPAELVDEDGTVRRNFVARQGIVSLAGLPLRAGGTLLGVLLLNFRTHQRFTPAERSLFDRFALEATEALASKWVWDLAEQQRLIGQFHDAVKQPLVEALSTFYTLEHAAPSNGAGLETIAHGRKAAAGALAALNLILQELRAGKRPTDRLSAVLMDDLKAMMPPGGPRLHIAVADDLPELSVIESELYLGIIREAVANATRHGRGSRITVGMRYDRAEDALVLEVEDDGQGFDPVAAPVGASQGLQIMRERAAQLAAALEVDAAPGRGTRIRCTVPFGEKEFADDVAAAPRPAAGAAR